MTHCPSSLSEKIQTAKAHLGSQLVILAHHYQNDAIVDHADFVGDSLELARLIPDLQASFIVFCGVHFMAESAAILAQKGQRILIPDASSRCVMSETAPAWLVETILNQAIRSTGRRIIPLAYVNSSAAVKAVCGRFGGSVCTSANAQIMLQWAFTQGDAVLFLPDKNLALNTAKVLGLKPNEIAMLNIRSKGQLLDPKPMKTTKLLVWPGQCAVHYGFKSLHISNLRRNNPKITVVVHPECSPEVVSLSNAMGSTSFIICQASEAPNGHTLAIGTEINLVDRLAKHYAGQKKIVPLARLGCSNMAKNTPDKLAGLLKNISNSQPIHVDEAVSIHAQLALTRMLGVGKPQ